MTDKPDFVFGTMRLTNLDRREAVQLLVHMLVRGIRHFHISHEYDSHQHFCDCLPEALKASTVAGDELVYCAKLASPHFGETGFSIQRVEKLLDEYRKDLAVDTIDTIQWMARGDLKNEAARLVVAADKDGILGDGMAKLKSAGHINRVGCFPYTSAFADFAIQADWCDVLVDYHNRVEPQSDEVLNGLVKRGKSLLALRPLYPLFCETDTSFASESVDALLGYALQHKSVEGVVVSPGSIQHADQLIELMS